MSYNSQFTGQQADTALQKAAVIQTDNDGTKFLADDGTYKEAGDKTNVLILSLENDLANGQKDSPVDAEVSASLVDAVTTGKACVIKSANSDILANLQKIGNNVTIIMEQISRVGQTFVAVNTSITVNTSTNVIADYQTGALVLETSGNGNKFLADDGKYKAISGGGSEPLDLSIFTSDSGTLSTEDYQKVVSAYSNNVSSVKMGYYIIPALFLEMSGTYMISYTMFQGSGGGTLSLRTEGYVVNPDKSYEKQDAQQDFKNTGNGTQFLSDDGSYKSVQPMKVLSESEYSALGTTPETDNVLYFVTPD